MLLNRTCHCSYITKEIQIEARHSTRRIVGTCQVSKILGFLSRAYPNYSDFWVEGPVITVISFLIGSMGALVIGLADFTNQNTLKIIVRYRLEHYVPRHMCVDLILICDSISPSALTRGFGLSALGLQVRTSGSISSKYVTKSTLNFLGLVLHVK